MPAGKDWHKDRETTVTPTCAFYNLRSLEATSTPAEGSKENSVQKGGLDIQYIIKAEGTYTLCDFGLFHRMLTVRRK